MPPPAAIKLAIIVFWADFIGADTLVETGTYLGDTVRALAPRFRRVVTIELSEALALEARREHAGNPRIQVITGDSAARLSAVVRSIDGATIFWLDAHCSGEETVGGSVVPIFAELDAIAPLKFPHVILVDDMRCFVGSDGYADISELEQALERRGYRCKVVNDVLQAIPRGVV